MSLRSFYYLPAYYVTLLLFGAGGLGLSLLSLLSGWLPATERSERFFQRLIRFRRAAGSARARDRRSDQPIRRRPSRSSTLTPPYSIRIRPFSCSEFSAWLTRWRDNPIR